jgi:multidrug transporter EmrE-like cation transporter
MSSGGVALRAAGFWSTLLILFVSVSLAFGGQIMLKAAMNSVGHIGSEDLASPLSTAARAAREPRLWTGLLLFAVSALFWLVVLSRVPLSVAYPSVGMSYVFVVLFSRLWLHEEVPPLRWLGVVVIVTGIALVGISFNRTPS